MDSIQTHALTAESAMTFTYFAVITKILRAIGMWYDENTNMFKSVLFVSTHLLAAFGLVTLEWVYFFTCTDYVEGAKTVSAIAYHTLCIVKIINSLRAEKDFRNALRLLIRGNNTFESFYFEQDKDKREMMKARITFNSFWKIANRNSIFILIAFTGVANSSILFSYANALTKTTTEHDDVLNVTRIVGVIPYNHYHLLDLSNKMNFFIEAFGQFYIITYLTFSFLCMPVQQFCSLPM